MIKGLLFLIIFSLTFNICLSQTRIISIQVLDKDTDQPLSGYKLIIDDHATDVAKNSLQLSSDTVEVSLSDTSVHFVFVLKEGYLIEKLFLPRPKVIKPNEFFIIKLTPAKGDFVIRPVYFKKNSVVITKQDKNELQKLAYLFNRIKHFSSLEITLNKLPTESDKTIDLRKTEICKIFKEVLGSLDQVAFIHSTIGTKDSKDSDGPSVKIKILNK